MGQPMFSGGGFEPLPKTKEALRFDAALQILKALLSNIATPVERVDQVVSQALIYADALAARVEADAAAERETAEKAVRDAAVATQKSSHDYLKQILNATQAGANASANIAQNKPTNDGGDDDPFTALPQIPPFPPRR